MPLYSDRLLHTSIPPYIILFVDGYETIVVAEDDLMILISIVYAFDVTTSVFVPRLLCLEWHRRAPRCACSR
jgi:hypothetical protein